MRAKSSKQRCPALCRGKHVAVSAPTNDVSQRSNGIAATKTQSQQNNLLVSQPDRTVQRLRSQAD